MSDCQLIDNDGALCFVKQFYIKSLVNKSVVIQFKCCSYSRTIFTIPHLNFDCVLLYLLMAEMGLPVCTAPIHMYDVSLLSYAVR